MVHTVSVRHGMIFVALGAMCWGFAGFIGRMLAGASGADSIQVAASRVLIGGLGLVALALVTRRAWSLQRAWRRVLLMAALVMAYQGCFFAAVSLGPISIVTLLTAGSTPVFVILITAMKHRYVRRIDLGIVALALVGLSLLVKPADGETSSWGLVVGLALCAGLSFAILTVANVRVIEDADPLATLGVAFLVAGSALSAVSLVRGNPIAWSANTVTWMVILGLGSTALGYALYFTGLPATAAAVASIFTLLEPLTATVVAMLAFGERLALAGWAGAVVLIVAVGTAAVLGPDRRRTG